MLAFFKRNQALSEQLGENVTRARTGVSPEVLEDYFRNLEGSLRGVPLANIVNYDETGFSDDPGQHKAIFRRGARRAENILDHSKTHISVMFTIAAGGEVLPPYVVYKAKYVYDAGAEVSSDGACYEVLTR